jgi:hypothetical protein
MTVIQNALAIYGWVVVGALIVFLWRIAFFYEKTSGRWVGHYLVFIPGGLMLSGVVRYFVADKPLVGDAVGDLLLFVGGVGVALFGLRLQQLMTGERK